MFDKKMFIDTLKVSPEASLDTFGRVRKINEDKEKNNPLTVHVNGKGIPSGAFRSDTIPRELEKHLPPNHSAVNTGHIGRKGVTVVSWQAQFGGKNIHRIAAVMPDEEADEANRHWGNLVRASGHLD